MVDDVIIANEELPPHVTSLRRVLTKLAERHHSIKPEKMQILRTQGTVVLTNVLSYPRYAGSKNELTILRKRRSLIMPCRSVHGGVIVGLVPGGFVGMLTVSAGASCSAPAHAPYPAH